MRYVATSHVSDLCILAMLISPYCKTLVHNSIQGEQLSFPTTSIRSISRSGSSRRDLAVSIDIRSVALSINLTAATLQQAVTVRVQPFISRFVSRLRVCRRYRHARLVLERVAFPPRALGTLARIAGIVFFGVVDP